MRVAKERAARKKDAAVPLWPEADNTVTFPRSSLDRELPAERCGLIDAGDTLRHEDSNICFMLQADTYMVRIKHSVYGTVPPHERFFTSSSQPLFEKRLAAT